MKERESCRSKTDRNLDGSFFWGLEGLESGVWEENSKFPRGLEHLNASSPLTVSDVCFSSSS